MICCVYYCTSVTSPKFSRGVFRGLFSNVKIYTLANGSYQKLVIMSAKLFPEVCDVFCQSAKLYMP